MCEPGRQRKDVSGWGGLRLAAELGLVAGVASAIALAAAGPASRLATWGPARPPLTLTAATAVAGDERLAGGMVLAQLPPPFGADAVALGPGSATRAPQPTPRPVPSPTAPPPAATALLSGPSAQTLAGINQARSLQGLGGLRADAALTRAAIAHAARIAAQGSMTHTGYIDDVNSQGVSWQGLGEVLGDHAQVPDPTVIIQFWLQSPEHRPIVLDPRFSAAGVGWAQSSTGLWYVAAILMY